jgi:A/G-specific adenine glycosylase
MPRSSLFLRARAVRFVTDPYRSRVAQATAAEFVRRLQSWGRANRRSFPWRETRDPFRILVAEVLLQRSRGKTVAKVYEELFERWPDAEALAGARVPSIRSVIRPLGLIRRAEGLKALAAAVVGRGGVPRTLDDLLALPGVGRYAASTTLAVAFGRRRGVVDGVTARVYRRYFGLPGAEPASADDELWNFVEGVTPSRGVREWNWSVLDLAAAVCLPGSPRCEECPLQSDCSWSHEVSALRVSATG